MIPRRQLVTGGVLGGLLGALATADDADATPIAAGGADVTEATVLKIAQAIADLRDEVLRLKSFPEIVQVRETQLTYLRVNGKFPDFIEVGTSVWFGVHDWHVRWQQPMSLGRDSVGRYTIALNQSVLIMRADAAPTFIGVAYDNR